MIKERKESEVTPRDTLFGTMTLGLQCSQMFVAYHRSKISSAELFTVKHSLYIRGRQEERDKAYAYLSGWLDRGESTYEAELYDSKATSEAP